MYTVYWVVFTGVKLPFSLSLFNNKTLQHQIFIYIGIYLKTIPNNEIIAKQIDPDNEKSEQFTSITCSVQKL